MQLETSIEVHTSRFLGIGGRYVPLDGNQGAGPVTARLQKNESLHNANIEVIALALSRAYQRMSHQVHARQAGNHSKVVSYVQGMELVVASVREKDGFFLLKLNKTSYVSPYDVLRDLRL